MSSIRNARLLQISGLLLSVLVWLANSANPTNGRTGAPFDGHCNSCHTGNNPNGYDGTVEIGGMPAVVQPNTVYPLTITLTATAGTPSKAGFQLVSVDDNNSNAGNLANANTQSGTETITATQREYIEHRGAKNFSGGTASWSFNWTSPGVASGGHITFWYIGNFTNGNGADSGDRPLAFSTTYDFNGPSDPVTATIGSFSNPTCNGANDGSITVTAAGGTAPYTYLWSNGQTTATASNLLAGTYTVTVTGASGTGTATAVKQLTQPASMAVNVNAAGQINCAQTTINVTATASGGTAPYTYQWSNGTSGQQTTYSQAGTYTVTVTATGGCTKTATGTIIANVTPPTVVVAPPGTITCVNPTVTLNGTGSSTGAGFVYTWTASNGGNITSGATTLTPTVNACGIYTLVVTNNTNGCTASASRTVACNTSTPQVTVTGGTITCASPTVTLSATSPVPGALFAWSGPDQCINAGNQNIPNPVVHCAGAYTVTVTNPANGCTNTATAFVDQDAVFPLINIGPVLEISCDHPSTQIPLPPVANHTYAWTGPCFVPGTQQMSSPSVCSQGVYTVTVKNEGNGCTSTASVAVVANITQPLVTIAVPDRLNCNNTTVQLSGTGSSQGNNITYQWSTTGGNIVSGATTLTPVVNQPGSYRLVVENVTNGCTAEASIPVFLSTPVTATAVATQAICFGAASGAASVTASGGVGPYTYAWSNNDMDANAGNLSAGNYSVTVSDVDGCTAVATATVTQPTELQVNVTTTAQTALNLSDGTASATVTGGTPGYTYIWSNGATTAAINGLAPGSYTVTATDAHGCTALQIANVNSFNCSFGATITTTDVSCHGGTNGSAAVQVTGATLPVTYLWSNATNGSTAANLPAGSYTVSLTDAAGCPLVLNTEVEEPTTLTVAMSATGETALGAHNGTATAQPGGGTPGYSYVWNTNATGSSIGTLAPGTYTVTVRDANGCSAVESVIVPSVSCDLETEMIVTPVKCFNTPSGTATVIVTGATGNITYAWSNGGTTETADNLTEGTVTVTVTDEVGCSAVATAEIVGPAELLVASVTDVNHVFCPTDQNGSATPDIDGGWGTPYTFQFSWGIGGFQNLAAGDYSFTVTDQQGCSVIATFEINVLDSLGPVIQCPTNIVLCGADLLDYPLPEVTDDCSGATPAVLISGLPSGSAFLDGVTTQVFRAMDAAGNSSTCSFSVTVYAISDVVINSTEHDTNGSGSGSIDVEAVGDSGPFTFEWKKNGAFYAATEDLDGLTTGLYTLIMTDVNGCTVQLAPIFIDNIVDTDNPSAEVVRIRLWPNPARDAFQLEMSNIDPVSMEILNPQGQLVRVLEPAEWNSEISVNGLPTGFYYLKVMSRSGVLRVVKWGKVD